MLGMVALDSATTHGRKCGELRCRFIFRFYDRDEDGLLSFEEFKWVFQIVLPELDEWFIKDVLKFTFIIIHLIVSLLSSFLS